MYKLLPSCFNCSQRSYCKFFGYPYWKWRTLNYDNLKVCKNWCLCLEYTLKIIEVLETKDIFYNIDYDLSDRNSFHLLYVYNLEILGLKTIYQKL